MGKRIYKTGWWKVNFDISLFDETEGKREKEEGIRFEDLTETTQEHIINCIKDGYHQGQIVEDYELDDDEDDEEVRNCHCSNCLANFRESQIKCEDEKEFCPACGMEGCIADGKTEIEGAWNYDPCEACGIHTEVGCRGCLEKIN